MSNRPNPESIPALLEGIEIPDSAYERAKSRYEALGEWLCRPESSVRKYDPVVFAQGSFLLGTVTRPVKADGGFDLDLVIKLRRGVTKQSHTQKELKEMIGDELEAYRKAQGIKAELDEKRRCWRLEYADDLTFHIDALPCVPEDDKGQQMIKEAIITRDASESALAEKVAALTVAITDNTHADYPVLSNIWNVSNPQGFGHWFASRVRLATDTVRRRLLMEKRAEVEELPAYKLKAPLQQAVQLLKLHRDEMFKDDRDRQPISIIITTLAARAYDGQEDVTEALLHILDTMEQHIHPSAPRVPNPVNPNEDFSDKWETPEGRRLELERHFKLWLHQARIHFRRVAEAQDADTLQKRAEEALGIQLNRQRLRDRLGPPKSPPVAKPPPRRIVQPPRPWSNR